MRTRVKGLLALALTFLAGCTIGVLARECRPEWFSAIRTRHQPPMELSLIHISCASGASPSFPSATGPWPPSPSTWNRVWRVKG